MPAPVAAAMPPASVHRLVAPAIASAADRPDRDVAVAIASPVP
jgi:hypothetical protein